MFAKRDERPAALTISPNADRYHPSLDEIEGLLTPIRVAAGRVLIEEGSIGREFFVIRRGRAEVRRHDETIGELADGDYFGELALLGSPRRTASVVAMTDMEVLVANPREFRALLRVAPGFADQIEELSTSRRLALAS